MDTNLNWKVYGVMGAVIQQIGWHGVVVMKPMALSTDSSSLI